MDEFFFIAAQFEVVLLRYGACSMKVQKAHLLQPILNLGEAIPVPAQACLYTRAKGRATYLAVRTMGGR